MPTNRTELKKAVHTILSDIIEQCFRHLINFPQQSDALNIVIKDATNELNYLTLKIDAHNYEKGTELLQDHYRSISKDLHKKSLRMLGRLQKIQKEGVTSASGE